MGELEVMTAMKAMFAEVLQQVMDCELEEKLGYEKSERMSNADEKSLSKNYRNGRPAKTGLGYEMCQRRIS